MTDKNNLLILAKDALFILAGLVLFLFTGFLGRVVGIVAVIWYGRDLFQRIQLQSSSREPRRDPVERPSGSARDADTPIIDDGRIQVTDLNSAREVDFEKE